MKVRRNYYRCQHTLALTNGTAAAEKSEDEHDAADDDDDDGQRVQRLGHVAVTDHVAQARLRHLRPDTDRQQRAAHQLYTRTAPHPITARPGCYRYFVASSTRIVLDDWRTPSQERRS